MTKTVALFALVMFVAPGERVGSAKDSMRPATVGADRAQLMSLGYYGEKAAEQADKSAPKCPGADDGSELIGTEAKEWALTDWSNSPPLTLQKLRGRVVVVRFWSIDCPFCEKSMPALQRLAAEFRDQPLTMIGVFHAKPAEGVLDMTEPLKVAKSWAVTFPLAFDRKWRTVRSWFLDGHHRHATSATFVIGKDGKIVHVHPGPVFYPTDVAADAQKNRDYVAVRDAIRTALAGRQSHSELHTQSR